MKKLEVSRGEEKRMETISPFELKNKLIELAAKYEKNGAGIMLNAGRGNPNLIATLPREAFFTLGLFGLEECRRVMNLEDHIAGIPEKKGAGKRFEAFLNTNSKMPGIELLKQTFEYGIKEKGFDPDAFAFELAEGIMGDQYPEPGRMLVHTDQIVHDYLIQEMCNGKSPGGKYDLFATEGGTAAMCYLFDSLRENFLLQKDDQIALMLPTFTPYIEIPELEKYSLKVVKIMAETLNEEGFHSWQYPAEHIDMLKDKKIKALFLTNPSNPPSYVLSDETVNQIKDIVENHNPELMIITDDVYGTFANNFRSLMAVLPRNTLCVYSFSKYFGATGWRLATISLYQDNIYDDLLKKLSPEQKEKLNKRYSTLSLEPEKIKFIDRLVADSRQVALNHTAGLSWPQQMQMLLFSTFALLDKENKYKKHMQQLIKERYDALWKNMNVTPAEDPRRVGYYTEIDLLIGAERYYGKEFADFLVKNFEPVDVVFRLAEETGVVLMNGSGFDGPEWSVRVSLANLNKEDYENIGKAMRRIFESYHAAWEESKK
jgi:aspartate 4-decarboxylase